MGGVRPCVSITVINITRLSEDVGPGGREGRPLFNENHSTPSPLTAPAISLFDIKTFRNIFQT